ncbi:hypothetical protein [Bacillus sp. FJAT-28004]|uniref:YphA family membrane protein n=1 Tax=Bacillus sp. FJAT-28004 TaxID=1679165 RepID=UPI0006B60AED|nr:hypothetical protein [Bacillus sp. FJAT-28004]
MNPGYMSIWIMIIMFILIVTGWKPYLAPDISRRMLSLLGIAIIALLSVSFWLKPFQGHIQVELHISICLLLVVGILGFVNKEDWSYIGYLILCTLMLAVIWGFIRKMYSFDPVFHWFDPSWDAPLLCGIFCGAFTSNVKHQFGMIVWGAVLGETLNAALQVGAYTAHIGNLAWWDSFWIAMATAMLCRMLLKSVRIGFSKLSIILWHLKGGRPS